MMRKLSRRNFLKTAGATVLAAAAMSTLTACGGGGSSSPSPAPSKNNVPDKEIGALKLKDVAGRLTYSYKKNDPNKTPVSWQADIVVTLENTKDQAVELNFNNVDVLLDGKVPQNGQTSVWVRDETDTHQWYALREPLMKIEKGKPVTVEIEVALEKNVYEQWTKGEGNHSLAVTLKHDGKKVTYTLDSKKTTTVSNVENA